MEPLTINDRDEVIGVLHAFAACLGDDLVALAPILTTVAGAMRDGHETAVRDLLRLYRETRGAALRGCDRAPTAILSPVPLVPWKPHHLN